MRIELLAGRPLLPWQGPGSYGGCDRMHTSSLISASVNKNTVGFRKCPAFLYTYLVRQTLENGGNYALGKTHFPLTYGVGERGKNVIVHKYCMPEWIDVGTVD